jgi:hypothetical protein
MRTYLGMYITIGLMLIIVGVGLELNKKYNQSFNRPARKIELNFVVPDSSLSFGAVQEELLKHGIKHPEIVYRQVCWETGWLSSKNCLERNNLTGMKGGTVTPNNTEGYKIYSTWQHSIRAYARWQRRWYGDSKEDYYSFLIRIRYAKDPEKYVTNLKSLNTNWDGN